MSTAQSGNAPEKHHCPLLVASLYLPSLQRGQPSLRVDAFWLTAFFLAGPVSSWNLPLVGGRASADQQQTTECRLQLIIGTHFLMASFYFLCNYDSLTARFRMFGKVVKIL